MYFVLAALLGVGCATDGPVADSSDRGPLGKGDVIGSCADSDCSGPAEGGNCWCDDECDYYGDCCEDKLELCDGAVSLATFNTGLAYGAVPMSEQRVPAIANAIADSPADVICMQEVWTDDDVEAIRDAAADEFPYSFYERTEDDSKFWFSCNPINTYRLDRCVKQECTAHGISVFECVQDQCKEAYDRLPDDCKLCLAANTTAPWKCAVWGAPQYAWGGRNGLLLLSRQPIENPRYTPFDTLLIKRGVITADIGDYRVQCSHMTPNLESVPYPADHAFTSWAEEHRAQIELMAEAAGENQCTALLGDLNSGPEDARTVGELPDNFDAIQAAGYVDLWAEPVCTMCEDNPLCDSDDIRIDHALFRNCSPYLAPQYQRIFDSPLRLTLEDGSPFEGRLSDHYGLMVTLPAGE